MYIIFNFYLGHNTKIRKNINLPLLLHCPLYSGNITSSNTTGFWSVQALLRIFVYFTKISVNTIQEHQP